MCQGSQALSLGEETPTSLGHALALASWLAGETITFNSTTSVLPNTKTSHGRDAHASGTSCSADLGFGKTLWFFTREASLQARLSPSAFLMQLHQFWVISLHHAWFAHVAEDSCGSGRSTPLLGKVCLTTLKCATLIAEGIMCSYHDKVNIVFLKNHLKVYLMWRGSPCICRHLIAGTGDLFSPRQTFLL